MKNDRGKPSAAVIIWFYNTVPLIPTRCRGLYLKQFCLENITPAILIILITHIVLAVRWMLIKILSEVINHLGKYKAIVSGGLNLL